MITAFALRRDKALGDVLLALPLAWELRQAGHAVSLTTAPRLQPLIDRCPALDEPRKNALVIDLQHTTTPWRRGLPPAPWLDPLRRALGRPTRLDTLHTLDRYRQAVGLAQQPRPPLPDGPLLEVAPDRGQAADALRVGLAPTTSHPTRDLPPESLRFACALLASLARRSVQPVLLAGGAPASFAPLLTALGGLAGVERVETRALDGDALRLAGLTAGCDLVIGADTGPCHLAQALDVPTLVLFGPTSVQRWGPWRRTAAALAPSAPCSPCSGHGQRPCHVGHRACLEGWAPSRLEAAIHRMWQDRVPIFRPNGDNQI